MQNATAEMLAKRRDRAIAICLAVKEREIDRHLSPDAKAKLRKVILDQFNELHDFFLEILRSTDNDTVVNELWLEKLDAIYNHVVVGNGHRG